MSDRAVKQEGANGARRARGWLLAGLAFALLAAVASAFVHEARHSWLQARELARHAQGLDFALAAGPSDAIRFPPHGPFDQRLGYAHLERFAERLAARGYVVERQVRFSPALMAHVERGLFPPYREKTRAGLQIADRRGAPMFGFAYPHHAYAGFVDIPPVVVESLLFIENRGLLDPRRPHLNPAIDWPRFVRAAIGQVVRSFDDGADAPGASTLATQIEKYRHSPDGLTPGPAEKLRQMASASIRGYAGGPDTLAARERLVLDYLNTVPLSAAPRFGAVHGLGDGLWVWFGTDFDRVNALLGAQPGDGVTVAEQGRALREVMSLLIAHRRPSYYLGRGREELAALVDSYLRLLAAAGIVEPALRDAAHAAELEFRNPWAVPAHVTVDADKGATMVRTRLATLLGVSLYELDRLDLDVSASLDRKLQHAVSAWLERLVDADFARSAGLVGHRLLAPATLADVRYSFTLFESTPEGNRVRVQTDTTDQPLDINEGSKLELGSTAKLRVLATYLEIIAELHARYADDPAEELRSTPVDREDVLTRWALDYLIRADDRGLPAMLEAALERRYPASTAESFFTGGGVHRFSNFRREDDGRHPTVREALQASINLPYVRLQRDIVRHAMYQVPGSTARLLQDESDERRHDYLARFADREGRVFLGRFWRKYRDLEPEAMRALLLDGLRPTPDRLAAVFRYLEPEADQVAFEAFLREHLADARPGPARTAALYDRYAPGRFDLPDQGYVARVHPLELWLVGHLSLHPGANFADIVAASRDERQAVYRWLFRTRAKGAQDQRIYTILEVEAFLDIHRRWARLGFPFDSLVPSLATALGSSGDRPAALAELMGIIVNDGMLRPSRRIERLEFAVGTPYETAFVRADEAGVRVMAPEVAAALRSALSDVVEGGTARRLAGAFRTEDGRVVEVGGKTGTGDNRIVIGGARSQGRGVALNRTATFVFHLGPSHFGTITAYVTGPEAARHRFTSALPVQILKAMGPILVPAIEATQDPAIREHPHAAGQGGREPEAAPDGSAV